MKPTVEFPYGNYLSPLFEQRTSRYLRGYKVADSNKHHRSGYPFMHMGEEEQTDDGFSEQKNPSLRAGFKTGTPRSPVLSLTIRPTSPHVHVMHDFEYQNAKPILVFRFSIFGCSLFSLLLW